MDGEGHFVALMQKGRTPEDDVSPEKSSAYISEADEEPSDHDDVKRKKKQKKDEKIRRKEMRRQDAPDRNGPFWRAFADVKAEVDWKRIEVRKGFAYYLPEGVEGKKSGLCAKRTLSWGDTKDRFEPSQAFAMVLQKKNLPPVLIFRQRMSE